MSFANLGAHWWVILIIVVLLFGAPKLPALARSMGQSMRIFRSEMKNKDGDPDQPTAASTDKSATDKVTSTEPGDTASKP
jgi:sec-independent protein translocase protein TatA